MRLLLIRHGQTTSNVLGLLDSRVPGADLTALGQRQAEAIPGALAEHPVTSIFVSNMIRTSQTATPLARRRGLQPAVDEGLREIEGGELEMASGVAAYKRYIEPAWAWGRGDLGVRMPGAQDGFEFFERFDSAVERISREGGTYPVAFSHAAAIRVWIGHRCANVADDFAADAELHNTGSALVERDGSGSWRLVEWRSLPLGGDALEDATVSAEEDPTGSLTEDDLG